MKSRRSSPAYLGSNCPVGRPGFTVLELLVAVSMTVIVMSILLPTMGAARESARRAQCTSHLREIGGALHQHHDARRVLPAGWTFDAHGASAYGWAVPLLPYLRESRLFADIDIDKRVSSPPHRVARSTPLNVMLCPSDITEAWFTLYEEEDFSQSASRESESSISVPLVRLPTANYVGMFGTMRAAVGFRARVGDGTFIENEPISFRDFVRGTSHTIVVGERTMAQVPSTWLGIELAGEDAAARLVGSALQGINDPMAEECEFSSRHPGGAIFLWGDGRVSFVSEEVDLDLYQRMSRL